MDKEYSLTRAISDFSLEEITDGAEWALTYDVNPEIKKNKTTETVTSRITDTEGRSPVTNEVKMVIDRQYGELISTDCSCRDFQDDLFGCPHIYAMACAYFMKKSDRYCFEATPVEEELVKRTGVNTPFEPGILKKSDAGLKNLIKKDKKQGSIYEQPWLAADKKYVDTAADTDKKKNIKKTASDAALPISLDCILHTYSDGSRVSIEIKAGPKKHYIIKNFGSLYSRYKSGGSFDFSASLSMPAGRGQYTAESTAVMDFLGKIYDDADRRDKINYLFVSMGRDQREMWLDGRDLDAFMEILNGRTVDWEAIPGGGRNVRVDLEYQPEPMSLTKEKYGARLSCPGRQLLGFGLDYLYLFQGGYIYRRPIEELEKTKQLIKAFGYQDSLYVQEKDLPALCENLLPVISDENKIKTVGMELSRYIAEVPVFKIYLDLPQDDLITAGLKAYYRSLDQEISCFDQKTKFTGRNTKAEMETAGKIWNYFDAFDRSADEMVLTCDENKLYIFVTETIKSLAEFGEVMISDALKKLKVRSVSDFSVGIQVDAGSLTMSLKSNVMGKQEMLEMLCAYDRKKNFTRLKNGEFITVDPKLQETFEAMAEQFRNYGKKDPEAFKIPLFRAMYINECLKDRDSVTIDAAGEYRDLLLRLSDKKEREYACPESLKDLLRPYQLDGYRWIKMLKESGFGGILADDMGLGKTLQVLAFVLSEVEEKKDIDELRTLIVSPASLVYNWQSEVEKFTPGIPCRVIAGSAAARREIISSVNDDKKTVIYITSYDLLKRDLDAYEDIKFANEVVDEAQFIKNQNTDAAKSVRIVNSSFRLALTGTPIENRLSDLWSIFDYLMPGLLYGYARFRQEYETPVVSQHDQAVMDRLRRLVHPFILRRLKKDVLKDLPDKLEETVSVRLEGEQRKLYDAYAERLRLFLEKQSDAEFTQSKIEVLSELTKLRQICCGPELLLEKYKGGNAKLEACMELVRQAIDGGHKILLFSQFTSALDEIGKALKKNGIAFHRIDGSVSKEDRMQLVKEFDSDDVPVFCISLKAGGTGLNLTAADIVIHYDPWWNIAAQNQATDRAHRIGQTNAVTVYRLIAEKTIEEQITKLQQTKAALAEDLLSGEGISSILIDKDELLKML